MKIRTTNSLMKYLREKHNIYIEGTKDKKNLRNIGYYHGYKGYWCINKPQNRINLSSFDEISKKLIKLLYNFCNSSICIFGSHLSKLDASGLLFCFKNVILYMKCT